MKNNALLQEDVETAQVKKKTTTRKKTAKSNLLHIPPLPTIAGKEDKPKKKTTKTTTTKKKTTVKKPTTKKTVTSKKPAVKAPVIRKNKEQTGSIYDKLWDHNKSGVNFLVEQYEVTDHAMVIQPTGSGKTGVTFGFIEKIISKINKVLIVQPYTSIEVNHKESMFWREEWADKIEYITYSMLATLRNKSLKAIEAKGFCGVDVVFFDEVHHLGAPLWLKGYQKLVECNPNCFVVGLTATPVRYLDNNMDVAKEFFNDNYIETITLTESIKQGVFKAPNYITGYFDEEGMYADLKQKIYDIGASYETQQALLSELEDIKEAWSRQLTVPQKIKAYTDMYCSEDNLKFAVFVPSIDKLKEYETLVKSWFLDNGLRSKVKTYAVYSGSDTKDEEVFDSFVRNHKNQVDLLFAVNKMNEGVHLNCLSGLIMLRNTASPIIYDQQLGRAFHAGMDKEPLIFDFVNNQEAIKTIKHTLVIGDEKPVISEDDIVVNGEDYIIPVSKYSTVIMHDDCLDLSKLITKINNPIQGAVSIWLDEESFTHGIDQLNLYIAEYKQLPQFEVNRELYMWFRGICGKHRAGLLSAGQVAQLEALGLVSKV